jgi:RimJ/RimL family protein N-acetyltransferase
MFELQEPDWWRQIPVLSGPTLQVREVEACDVETLFELLTDPRVTEYISSPPPSRHAFEGFIEWAHRQREAGSCVCFAVVPNGLQQAVGLVQLRALEPKFHIAEWGFALGAAFWSTGIFQEAAVLVAQFAFKTIGVQRLEARAVVDNGRGNRALEKLGAKGEAELRKAFNRTYTQFLWAIVSDEWKPPQAIQRSPFDAAKLKREIARAVGHQLRRTEQSHGQTSARPFPFFLTDSSRDPSEEH